MLEVIVAAITAIGLVLAAAIAGYYRVRVLRLKLSQAENEVYFQREALDITAFVKDWDGFVLDLKILMENSNIDRFSMLRAWNGYLEPRWTSAVFQFQADGEKMVSFMHVELDSHYIEQLRNVSLSGVMQFKTKDAPQGALFRGLGETEGIEESLWAHIETLTIPGTETKAITYCCFGTHDPAGIDAHGAARARIIIGQLKGMAHNFLPSG